MFMLGFDSSLLPRHEALYNDVKYKNKAICSQHIPLLSLQVFHQ